ncbi:MULTISPECIES: hypothetical protein [Burkholderia]|uniref:hypothetical protein n=1 Tax=Burkholderia TaxID=32008 RepID=UPI003AF41F8B
MMDANVVATMNQFDAEHNATSMGHQQIEAEFARYEAEAAAIKQRMDALSVRRESLREQERVIAIPEILARIAALGIKPEDLGYAPQSKKSTAPWIPRYRDPVTGKKHSGKGGLPDWLTPETKKDPSYENPEWTAKEAAKDEAKKAKAKSAGASVADQAPASNTAVTVSNDAPMMTNGSERNVAEGGAAVAVTSEAAIDVTDAASNTSNASIVSSTN